MSDDEALMDQALAAGAQCHGLASPNPVVGCVVARDGGIVGRGAHEYERRDHAEIVALREAGERARGATLAVTLEPCSTHGRTPPCVEAVLAAGVRRVVVAVADPTPAHAGAGIRALRDAGIEVVVGVRRVEAVRLAEAWLCWAMCGRPHVTVKVAMSLDGRIASASGASQWITGEPARASAHGLRRVADAVACGVGTVLTDDPRLSARTAGATAERPMRCVIDPDLRTPATARLLRERGVGAGPVVIFVREGLARRPDSAPRLAAIRDAGADVVELPVVADDGRWLDATALLRVLASRGARSVLVEGGGVTVGRFLAAGVVDRIVAHVAPMLLGSEGTRAAVAGFGAHHLADAVRLRALHARTVGRDVALEAGVEGGFDPEAASIELAAMED